LREGQRRLVQSDGGSGLIDRRMLLVELRLDAADVGGRRGDIRRGLRQRCPEVAVIDAGEHLPRLHRLIVAHEDFGNIALHLWCDDGVVGFDIGIVRGLQEPPPGPIAMAGPRHAGDGDDEQQNDQAALDENFHGANMARTPANSSAPGIKFTETI
jgi:hypothetical protein